MFLLSTKLLCDAEHTEVYVSSCRASVMRNLPFCAEKNYLRRNI